MQNSHHIVISHLRPRSPVSMEDDRLLAGGYRAVDTVQDPTIDKFVDEHSGLGV